MTSVQHQWPPRWAAFWGGCDGHYFTHSLAGLFAGGVLNVMTLLGVVGG